MNKPRFKGLLLLLLLTATATLTRAQQFGGNPPSLKWDQINTPAAKVIFPVGLDSSALWVANIVSQMNNAIKPTIGFKQRQISILLQNQTTIANGYVGLAPFRSEFYLTPDQNSFEIGSLPWPEQLAIHEFRHVQQYNNFDVGLSHVLRILFGEGGQALGNDLAVPNWFFEGDAVFNETHVSDQGRGRLPYFFNGFRALWAADKNYSYMKIRNGSLRDYTPDWYPLGYMLVSYGRDKYGDDFWKKVTHDAAAYKGGFYPFQRAIKKYSGLSFEQFRNNGLNYFKNQFTEPYRIPDSLLRLHKYNLFDHVRGILISDIHRHFGADREYPAYVNDSTLIYMKSTYDRRPVFVMKIGNVEKKISVRDFSIDNYFAYNKGKIVYASYRPDLRWNYRDYSDLVILNVNTGKERTITRKSKYFSPSFSNDNKTIVVVRVGPSGKSELHLLDANTGKLKSIIPNKGNLFYTYPKFYGDGKIISAVRSPKGQMSLDVIDVKTGENKFLLPFSYEPIAFPTINGDYIYYSRASGERDELYSVNLGNGRMYWLPNPYNSGAIGYYEPALSDKNISWVGFSANGYKITSVNQKSIEWLEVRQQKPGQLSEMGISALRRDSSTNLLASVIDSSLKITKYHKSYHLFNFHSLIPNINDPNYTLSIAGENVLNTFQSDLSFNYNRDEGYKEFEFDAIYGALFPYISGGADYILDRRAYYRGGNVFWNETSLHGGLELPLNFSGGKNSTYLDLGTDLYYSSSNFQAPYRKLFADQQYAYLNNYLNFSNAIGSGIQNIYPHLAQSISLNYKSAVSGISATQFLAEGNFFFPGLSVNHSFSVALAHQEKGSGNNVIDYSNDFPFSRGYTAENLHDMNKVGANYAFPIAYPDAGAANLVYFLRIRGNLFYDYIHATDTYVDGSPFRANFRSAGLEVFFDTKWFNQEPITFGFRYSHLQDEDIFGGTGRNRFEIVLPATFF